MNISIIYRNLAIVAGIIFIIQACRWTLNLQSFLLICAINGILILLFVVARWVTAIRKSKSVKVMVAIFCVLTFVAWGVATAGMETLGRWTAINRNPYLYTGVLRELNAWKPKLVEHFPKQIPKDATHVKFSYFPGFMQGGMHVQLRYQIPSAEIMHLYGRFSQLTQKTFYGGNTNIHNNEEGGMPTTFFFTSDSISNSFPKDYEIMIFDPLPSRSGEHYWNHGQSHGVAISKPRNEIIYWAEKW